MPETEIESRPATTSTPAPSSRENSSSTASRGRKVRCAIRPANTSPKSSKIGSAITNAIGAGFSAPSACARSSFSSTARRNARGCLRSLSPRIGRMSCASALSCSSRFATTISTLSLAAPNTRSLVSTTTMPSMSAACAARPSNSLIATTLADEIAFTTSARCAMLSSRVAVVPNSPTSRAPARRASPSRRWPSFSSDRRPSCSACRSSPRSSRTIVRPNEAANATVAVATTAMISRVLSEDRRGKISSPAPHHHSMTGTPPMLESTVCALAAFA